jgi:putative restriction endonuclease
MKKGQKLWTREELLIVINLYCNTRFGRLHKSNPDVIEIAKLISRTPSSVAYKLVNFASLDPSLQARGIKGASNSSKLDKVIWDEFYNNWEDLPYESEQLKAKFQNKKIEEISLENIPEGKDKLTTVKARVNQSFFRSAILSSYNSTCCVTGLSIPDLLIASHIKPWAQDKENRTNPHNGLCLNSIHDKAFDRGFMTITPDLKIKTSPYFNDYSEDKSVNEFFLKYDNQDIIKPDRFLPNQEFLEYHSQNIFIQ